MYIKLILVLSLLLLNSAVFCKGIYQTNDDFLKEVFNGEIPKVKSLWLTKQLKPQVKKIMGEKTNQLRVRYWGKGNETAWILQEIGKEKLITVGFVVENSQLNKVKVLAFRESRGWEIKEDFFTQQFKHVKLQKELQLNTHIDGISGATLSVRAVKKLARLALLFHQYSPFAQKTF